MYVSQFVKVLGSAGVFCEQFEQVRFQFVCSLICIPTFSRNLRTPQMLMMLFMNAMEKK